MELNKVVRVSFKGKASHAAAAPDLGRSAFDALQLVISAVERTRKHLPEGVSISYEITSSGEVAPNVVPDKAAGTFSIQAENWEHAFWAENRVKEMISGAAKMTGTSYELM